MFAGSKWLRAFRWCRVSMAGRQVLMRAVVVGVVDRAVGLIERLAACSAGHRGAGLVEHDQDPARLRGRSANATAAAIAIGRKAKAEAALGDP